MISAQLISGCGYLKSNFPCEICQSRVPPYFKRISKLSFFSLIFESISTFNYKMKIKNIKKNVFFYFFFYLNESFEKRAVVLNRLMCHLHLNIHLKHVD